MTDVPGNAFALSDHEIAVILDRAVRRLAALASETAILIPEAALADQIARQPAPAGWYELGALRDARGRFWYRVFWSPATGEGRLIRQHARARRGVLGEPLPEAG